MESTLSKIPTSSLYDRLVARSQEQELSPGSPERINALRKKAAKQFQLLGLPSIKVEDWKYTNLSRFLQEDFAIAETGSIKINKEIIFNVRIPSLDCCTIVLVNGLYNAELSDKSFPEGVHISPISNAYTHPLFNEHFGKYIDIEKNHFAALNTALFTDGLFINIDSKAAVSKPLHIIHVASAEKNLFLQSRNLFVIGAQAEAVIIESYITNGDSHADVFVNEVSEIVVGANAKLNHYYIQEGDEKTKCIHQTEIHQQSASLYNNYRTSFPGAALLRNNINVVLDGTNTESHLYGLYLAGGSQLVDNHTVVDHRQPNCLSNELYKGVMKDESKGIFNGKIFVRKHAQKTNAFQKNNNMILGKKATVDSKPQLEIYADDVKCSHGSTIGQFNDDALFYLKSRGIGDEKARALLIQAFVFDVTEKIPVPEIRAHIDFLIEAGLK